MEEEEALASEEAKEEALWNMHYTVSQVTSLQPDGVDSSPSTSENVMERPRFTGEYACDVCGETFISIVQLAKHRQFHDRDRPYQCSICGKRFLSRSHHYEHQRVHTGERPFPCERCERSFTTHHNLKRHMTIHEKEEMYRCQVCGVLFCQEHEYNLESLRLPATVPPAVTQTPALPMPMPVPVSLPVDIQVPLADDRPSSSNAMRIIQFLEEKKRKKKNKKKKKRSLLEVSKNIAALPLFSPTKKKHERDQQLYDYSRREEASTSHRKAHQMQRVAYDIEVVL